MADANNNRVLSYPASGSFSYLEANVVVGQTDFPFNTANLIEGREVWNAGSATINNSNVNAFGGGIVVDKGSNPPRLYIADTFNNRILGFRDARAVGTDARSLLTQKADLVIGQARFLPLYCELGAIPQRRSRCSKRDWTPAAGGSGCRRQR